MASRAKLKPLTAVPTDVQIKEIYAAVQRGVNAFCKFKHRLSPSQLDDLRDFGVEVSLRAFEKWDPMIGFTLTDYLMQLLRPNLVREGLRLASPVSAPQRARGELVGHASLELLDCDVPTFADQPDRALRRREMAAELTRRLAELADGDPDLAMGIESIVQGLGTKDLVDRYHVSFVRAAEVRRRSLAALQADPELQEIFEQHFGERLAVEAPSDEEPVAVEAAPPAEVLFDAGLPIDRVHVPGYADLHVAAGIGSAVEAPSASDGIPIEIVVYAERAQRTWRPGKLNPRQTWFLWEASPGRSTGPPRASPDAGAG